MPATTLLAKTPHLARTFPASHCLIRLALCATVSVNWSACAGQRANPGAPPPGLTAPEPLEAQAPGPDQAGLLGLVPPEAAAQTPAAPRKLADRILAVVGREPITLTQVVLEAKVLHALENPEQALQALALPAGKELIKTALAGLIEKLLIYNEWRVLSAAQDETRFVPREAIDAKINALRFRFASADEGAWTGKMTFEQYLRALDTTEEEIREITARWLLVKRRTQEHMDTWVQVSRNEIIAEFTANQLDLYPGKSLDEAEEAVRARIRDKKSLAEYSSWLVRLREGTSIRIIDAPDDPHEPG